jgi:hypothetical protein
MSGLLPLGDTPIADPRVAYRPSNGTEGEIFMLGWCARCAVDRRSREDGGWGCAIATMTMAVGIDDPEYPVEWRQDGPQGPRCTAWETIEHG